MTVDSGDVIICGLSAVALYMFLASLFEHKKVKFIHESAVAILIGFIVGLFVFFLFNSYFLRLVRDYLLFRLLSTTISFSTFCCHPCCSPMGTTSKSDGSSRISTTSTYLG